MITMLTAEMSQIPANRRRETGQADQVLGTGMTIKASKTGKPGNRDGT